MIIDIWERIFLGNSLKAWVFTAGILLVSFILIRIFKNIFIARLKKWSEKTETTIDDFIVETIEKSVVPLFYCAAIYLALKTLTFSEKIDRIIYVAFLFATTFFIMRIVTAAVKQFVYSFIQRQENSETKEKQAKGLLIIVNVALWAIGFVFLIGNLGYNVTTLVAGLGIGGIAIALAAQTILGDLFSYFVIFFDRPFEIGDFITVGDNAGNVEYVGIKTTRIRTLSGEQLVCSNTYLTNAQVHNFKRMLERRIVFKLGVTYQTSHQQLKKIPGIVQSIIDSTDEVRFDRAHFSGFGDFSLDFEVVYYVSLPDYSFYMDKQQEIYFEIVSAFEQEKIEFAYPTQTLFMEKAFAPKENSYSN